MSNRLLSYIAFKSDANSDEFREEYWRDGVSATEHIFKDLTHTHMAKYLVDKLKYQKIVIKNLSIKKDTEKLTNYLTTQELISRPMNLIGYDNQKINPSMFELVAGKIPSFGKMRGELHDDDLRSDMHRWNTCQKLSDTRFGTATYLNLRLQGVDNPTPKQILHSKNEIIKLDKLAKTGRKQTKYPNRTSSKYGELEKQLFGKL